MQSGSFSNHPFETRLNPRAISARWLPLAFCGDDAIVVVPAEVTVGVTREQLEDRVARMDVELKAFFDDQRSFMRDTFQAFDRRLTQLEGAFQRLERRMDERFDDLSTRVGALEDVFRKIDKRATRRNQRPTRIERQINGAARRRRK